MKDSKLLFEEGDRIPIQLEITEVDYGDDDRPYRVRIRKDDTYRDCELFEAHWLKESEILNCGIDPEYLETLRAKRNKERLAALREQRDALEAEIETLQILVDSESVEG